MPDPILSRLLSTIAMFQAGEIDVIALQGRLQSSLTAIDHSAPEIVDELGQLVEELEEIRFTSPEGSCRELVTPRLSALHDRIASALREDDARPRHGARGSGRRLL